jgi:hypothetical protein
MSDTQIFLNGKKVGSLAVEGRLPVGGKISMGNKFLVTINAIIGNEDHMDAVIVTLSEAA